MTLSSRFRFPLTLTALLCIFALPGCGSTESDPAGDSAVSQDSAASTNEDGPSDGETSDATASEDKAVASSKPDVMYSPEAFREAALNGKLRVVQNCVESGMDVNETDATTGLPALGYAAYNGHNNVVKYLIDSGATVDMRDRTNTTPLIHAASGPAPETVQTLLDAGADIDALTGAENYTALMTAAAEGNLEVVKVLLKNGADNSLVDDDGESAMDFAAQKVPREQDPEKQKRFLQIIQLLK